MFQSILSSASSFLGLGPLPSSFAFTIEKESQESFQHGPFVVSPGTAVKTSESVSVFQLSKSKRNTLEIEHARNFINRLKVLRHPFALQYLDSAENDGGIFLATERIQAFDISSSSYDGKLLMLSDLLDLLVFLHKDCSVFHGNLAVSSLVRNADGVIKIAGFFEADVFKNAELKLSRRDLPRVRGTPIGILADAVDFNSLAQEILAGSFPESWKQAYRDCTSSRLDGEGFFQILLRSQLLQENRTIDAVKFLRNVHVHGDAADRLATLNTADLPADIRRGPVVASIGKVLEVPSLAAAAAGILTSVSEDFETSEFKPRLLPLFLKLAAMPDRGVRYNLLVGLPSFIKFLDRKDFEKTMFVDLISGFTDSHPVIREHTVRASMHMVQKLKPSTISSKLMPHVARLLSDTEGIVRASAMQAIGSIVSECSDLEGRSEILITACVAALRDAYGSTRVAAIKAVDTSCAMFSEREICGGLLPALSAHLIDPEISVPVFDLMLKLMDKFRPAIDVARGGQVAAVPPTQVVTRAPSFSQSGTRTSFSAPIPQQAASVASTRSQSSRTGAPSQPAPVPTLPSLKDLDADFWAELDNPSK